MRFAKPARVVVSFVRKRVFGMKSVMPLVKRLVKGEFYKSRSSPNVPNTRKNIIHAPSFPAVFEIYFTPGIDQVQRLKSSVRKESVKS